MSSKHGGRGSRVGRALKIRVAAMELHELKSQDALRDALLTMNSRSGGRIFLLKKNILRETLMNNFNTNFNYSKSGVITESSKMSLQG